MKGAFVSGVLNDMSTPASKHASRWKNRLLKYALWDSLRCVAPAPCKPSPAKWSNDDVTFAWLGHATVLINFLGINILTDPVLAGRVGINAGPFVFGPKRQIRPALKYSELPPIDLILLSHSHFDHLDLWTLRRMGSTPVVVTAAHTSDLLKYTSLTDVHELAWNQSLDLFEKRGGLRMEAFPTQHWGARMGSDSHRRWNGYILERFGRKLIFAGDTGHTPIFAGLRGKGPFDVAIMPIGAYDPWITNHCTPEEALSMADAAGARFILPIHHQTFVLSREPLNEPIARLQRALEYAPERLAVRQIGETFVLPKA